MTFQPAGANPAPDSTDCLYSVGHLVVWPGQPAVVLFDRHWRVFPVLMNTIAGVRHVDGIYLRAARNLGVNQS